MARYLGPRGRLERREQCDLSLFSAVAPREKKIKTAITPGQHGTRKGKLSNYGKQFRAKQLAKRIYGVLEKQFYRYFKEAMRTDGPSGENLIRLLELRLDNVIYRLGLAKTRSEARQIISHKGVIVDNGSSKRVVNIPSFNLSVNDKIFIRNKTKQQKRISESLEISGVKNTPEWLHLNKDEYQGTVNRIPNRDEMPLEISESLIIEFYSR